MGRVPRVDWTKVDHVLLDMDGTLLDLAFDNDFWGHQIHAHYAALNKLSYESVVHKFEPLSDRLKAHYRGIPPIIGVSNTTSI